MTWNNTSFIFNLSLNQRRSRMMLDYTVSTSLAEIKAKTLFFLFNHVFKMLTSQRSWNFAIDYVDTASIAR